MPTRREAVEGCLRRLLAQALRAVCAAAARLAGGVRGGIEQPGASRRRAPFVSASAWRTSFATSSGVPSGSVVFSLIPPMTAFSVRVRPSASAGFPGSVAAQLIGVNGIVCEKVEVDARATVVQDVERRAVLHSVENTQIIVASPLAIRVLAQHILRRPAGGGEEDTAGSSLQ